MTDSDENARQKLERWVERGQRVTLTYARSSESGAGSAWTVTLILDEGPTATPNRVTFESTAMALPRACAGILAGLADYGIDVE